jgi:hypothetical protein
VSVRLKRKRHIPIPKNPFAPWSYRLIQQEANRRADAEILPQQGAIRGATAAAAKLFQDAVPETQHAYDLAGQAVAGFGKGFSDQFAADLSQGQGANADFLRLQGAPAQPEPVPVAAAHDTLFRGEGFNPASGLEAQGAAAGAYAAQQPGIEQARGNEDLIALAKKRPDLLNQIMDELMKREIDKANVQVRQDAQSLYQQQFGETQRHHVATEQASSNNYQLQVDKFNTQIQKAISEGRQPNASLSRAYGYIVDASGNPILANGHKIPVAQSSGSPTGKRGKAYAKALKGSMSLMGSPLEVNQHSAKYYQGKYVSKKGKSEFGDGSTNNIHNSEYDHSGYSFREAQQLLVDQYGVTRKQARRALIEAGWPPPAAAGRRGPRGPEPGTGPR